jgi:hypothetical protein
MRLYTVEEAAAASGLHPNTIRKWNKPMVHSFKAHDPGSNLKFDIKLEKDKRAYCFIGENGVGKTQLLENIARTLLLVHGCFFHNIGLKGFTNTSFDKNNILLFFGRLLGMPEIFHSDDLELDGISIGFKGADQRNTRGLINLGRAAHDVVTEIYCDLPLAFVSAKDRGYANNLSDRPQLLSENENIFRDVFKKNLFSMHAIESGNIHNENLSRYSVTDWIATRAIINPEVVAFDSKRVLAELDAFFNVLAPLMPKEISLLDDKRKKRVTLDQGRLFIAGTAIDKLPTGVISLMRIFQEIISTYSAWNGIMENQIENVFDMAGIVFIDEIESHMHPKWQAKIIPLLKKSFPNSTFYIATHSPSIIATVEKGEAYELRRDGVSVTTHPLPGDPRDWYLEDVFSVGFGVRFPRLDNGNNKSLENDILAFSKRAQDLMGEVDGKNKSSLKLELDRMYKDLIDKFKAMPNGEEDPRRDAVNRIWKYAQ